MTKGVENTEAKLIDLVDLRALIGSGRTARSATWSTRHAAGSWWHATARLVGGHHDGFPFLFEFLLLCFEFLNFSARVGINPFDGFIDQFNNRFFVILFDMFFQLGIVTRVSDLVRERFKSVLGRHLVLHSLILFFVSLGILHNLVDFFLRQTSLFRFNSDLPRGASLFVLGGHIQDTISRETK